MRSVIIKDGIDMKCGICNESEPWINKMCIEGICFIYCSKCNTLTFFDDIEYSLKNKIMNNINKEYVLKREK